MRTSGRTVILGAICYQIATKTWQVGSGAESWGIGPFAFTFHQLPTKQDTARNLKSIYHFLLALFTPGRATPRPREQTAQACDIQYAGNKSLLRFATTV
jgi:hypothetical protein